jgi:hypothetical protein
MLAATWATVTFWSKRRSEPSGKRMTGMAGFLEKENAAQAALFTMKS